MAAAITIPFNTPKVFLAVFGTKLSQGNVGQHRFPKLTVEFPVARRSVRDTEMDRPSRLLWGTELGGNNLIIKDSVGALHQQDRTYRQAQLQIVRYSQPHCETRFGHAGPFPCYRRPSPSEFPATP